MYEKRYSFSDSGGASRHWVTIATMSNIDKILKVSGMHGIYQIGGYWGSSANDYCGFTAEISSGTATIKMVRNGLVNADGFANIQYTKTTDTATVSS